MKITTHYRCPVTKLGIPLPSGWEAGDPQEILPGARLILIEPKDVLESERSAWIGWTVLPVPDEVRRQIGMTSLIAARNATIHYLVAMQSKYGATLRLEVMNDVQDTLVWGGGSVYLRFKYRREKKDFVEGLWMAYIGEQHVQLRFNCLVKDRDKFTSLLEAPQNHIVVYPETLKE